MKVEGDEWSLEIEETPAKKRLVDISDMEVNVGSQSTEPSSKPSEVSSLPTIQAQSTNTPVQSVSPEASVKGEPMLDLSNMAEIMNTELDLASLAVTDLGQMYRNLEQYRDKVNCLMSKVHKTMIDKMDNR